MNRKVRGFSLIEMMVTIAVLVILTAIAVPAFSDFMRRNAITSKTNDLTGALRLARSTAISRNIMVSICPSANAASATPTCATGTNYDTGWLVYTSATANAAYKASDELLQTSQGATNVSARATPSAAGQVVTFDARGTATAGAVAFLVCAKGSSDAVGQSTPRTVGRRIDVQLGGRSGSAPLGTAATTSGAQALCTAS